MTNKKGSEGVGKKIVEALKKQSNEVIEENFEDQPKQNLVESDLEDYTPEQNKEENNNFTAENDGSADYNQAPNYELEQEAENNQIPNINMPNEQVFDTSFLNNSFLDSQNIASSQPVYPQEPELNTENVRILSNLINQLPSGISKQAGAVIIKQTMEALGISMKTVLGEAQQMQEKISSSTNNCLNSIQEYKRQIIAMEKQVQQYHKQYNALNELISLFVQTGI